MANSQIVIDWMTAVGTLTAAVVAVIAVIVSSYTIRQDRRRQALRDRHQISIDLLAAFEEVHGYGHMEWRDGVKADATEMSRARARMLALLHASPESLPITRTTVLQHLPFGADNEGDRAYLASAPREGDPEKDDDLDMAMRAELIRSIDGLRLKLGYR